MLEGGVEYQLRRCIYDDVAYTPKFVGYPTVSDINKLAETAAKKGGLDENV